MWPIRSLFVGPMENACFPRTKVSISGVRHLRLKLLIVLVKGHAGHDVLLAPNLLVYQRKSIRMTHFNTVVSIQDSPPSECVVEWVQCSGRCRCVDIGPRFGTEGLRDIKQEGSLA